LKEKQRNILNGVLGTIIFHMVIVIFFMIFKLGEVRKRHLETLQIEFLNEYAKLEDLLAEKNEAPVDIQPLDAQTAKNIAVNVADKLNQEISTDKYVEEVKKELGIKELNQQHNPDLSDDNSPKFVGNNDDNKIKEKAKKEKYKGKTRITVNLPNRDIRRQDVPVYRCESGGVIVIQIMVDQMGNVINAVYSNDSGSKDECLVEEAIKYSYRFLFSADLSAEPRQRGTITFEFIPQ
jgi:hypothetical protein